MLRIVRPFVVCVHDATPAFARETRLIVRDLAPLLGGQLTFGVVPDWSGEWPLAGHPAYCRLLRDNAAELLLHGFCHRRRHGRGPVTLLADGSDEMNGLDVEATRGMLEHGQRVFTEVFGGPARGFVAPAWQRGHVRAGVDSLRYVLGFFALSTAAARIPLATWTWDCGRFGWLGHVGYGLGWMLQSVGRRVPVIAIHPRDIARGYWPGIIQLTAQLLERGYEPCTPARLVEASRC